MSNDKLIFPKSIWFTYNTTQKCSIEPLNSSIEHSHLNLNLKQTHNGKKKKFRN